MLRFVVCSLAGAVRRGAALPGIVPTRENNATRIISSFFMASVV